MSDLRPTLFAGPTRTAILAELALRGIQTYPGIAYALDLPRSMIKRELAALHAIGIVRRIQRPPANLFDWAFPFAPQIAAILSRYAATHIPITTLPARAPLTPATIDALLGTHARAAVLLHLAVTDRAQTLEYLAQAAGLPIDVAHSVTVALVRAGLVERRQQTYLLNPRQPAYLKVRDLLVAFHAIAYPLLPALVETSPLYESPVAGSYASS